MKIPTPHVVTERLLTAFGLLITLCLFYPLTITIYL